MLLGALVSEVGNGLVGATEGGLIGGEIASYSRPSHAIRRSGVSGLVAGLVGTVAGGVRGGLIVFLNTTLTGKSDIRLDDLLGFLLIVGLGWGLLRGLTGGWGACLQHAALRFLLRLDNLAPLNYTRFLDYATERIFLRKVGGGYIFVHRLLQDYFAELWEREYGGAE
jgi:hypothetical protein